MNKIALAACALAAAPLSHAALLLTENFAYTAGQTLSTANSDWTQFTVGSTNNLTTSATNLSVGGLQNSGGGSIRLTGAGTGNYHTFTPQTAGTTIYYSFAIQVTDLTGFTGASNIGFVNLLSNNATTTSRGGGIMMAPVKTGSVTTGYTLSINRLNNTPTSGGVPSNITLQAGETYFIVAAYQIAAGNANDPISLWINPASSSFGATAAPTATVTVPTGSTDLNIATTGINALSIQHSSSSSGLPTFLIDELRVGTTWADVTPLAIPEPASAAALVGGLAIGFAGLRRRSRR